MKRLLLIASLCAPCAALALDSVSVEAGHGTGRTNLARVGLQWHGHDNWFEHTNWHVARYIDLAFGGWNNGHQTVYDLGLTPVFRLERAKGTPYFEAAIGFHAVSSLDFDNGRATSTRFQFGDHVGVGFWLDERNDLTLRLQHLSNGGIRNPNPGINFLQIRLQHYLR
jgi:hypothetical protein